MAGIEKVDSGVSCDSATCDSRCSSTEMGSGGLCGKSAILLSVKHKKWYRAFMSPRRSPLTYGASAAGAAGEADGKTESPGNGDATA